MVPVALNLIWASPLTLRHKCFTLGCDYQNDMIKTSDEHSRYIVYGVTLSCCYAQDQKNKKQKSTYCPQERKDSLDARDKQN